MENAPVCMIYINDSYNIIGINSLFKDELQKIEVNPDDFKGDIREYIKEDIRNMSRTNTYIKIVKRVINSTVSFYNNIIFVEPSRCSSSFVRFINHELKTPLGSNVELMSLMSNTNLDAHQRGILSMMKSNSFVFTKTLNDTMDYLKLMSNNVFIHKTKFYLRGMIEDIKTNTVSSKVNIIYPDSDIKLFTDRDRFIQTVVHVLNHCLEHSGVKNIIIKVRKKQDHIVFYISDDGERIAENERDLLFCGFLNMNEDMINHKGYSSSLEMTISKCLAKLLGGDLFLEKTEDYGNTYKIYVEALDPEGSL